MPGLLIEQFALEVEGYAGHTVEVLRPGTTARLPLFYDYALTEAADNPQTLTIFSDGDGNSYGGFARPIYVGSDYVLRINSVDETGRFPFPISSLEGQDASLATTKPRASGFSRTLQELFSNAIYAADYGQFGTTAADNTAVLEIAIGQAAAAGGGDVILPAGSIEITSFTLPSNVHLVGQGHNSTTLQSRIADRVITVGGPSCGLRDLALDGISLVAGSIGIYGDAVDSLVLKGVTIKRLSTGAHFRGCKKGSWHNLSFDNCGTGMKLHGDLNVSSGGIGDIAIGNVWHGGVVSTCLVIGIDLSYEDATVRSTQIDGVFFDSNTGIALRCNGAQYTSLSGCTWVGNITDLQIQDDDLASLHDDAKVVGFSVFSGHMNGGAVIFKDTLDDVILESVQFLDVDFTLTSPLAAVQLLNCTQDSACTLAGDTTKLTSFSQTSIGNVAGYTSDATATKAWSSGKLDYGSLIWIEAVAVGFSQNTVSRAVYRKQAKFARVGSTLAYDGQTISFTVGQILTGATSGETARIIADSDSGATGTLTLRSISGEFEDNEVITDPLGGTAFANGTLTHQNVAQIGSTESVGTDFEDVVGWDMTIAAVAQEAEVRVTGAAATNIDWLVEVRAIRSS